MKEPVLRPTHIALHKNGPNRGCHLWPGLLDFFLIRAIAACSVNKREVQSCHSSAALITAYKWESKSCPAKAIPCLTIFIKTDYTVGAFQITSVTTYCFILALEKCIVEKNKYLTY